MGTTLFLAVLAIGLFILREKLKKPAEGKRGSFSTKTEPSEDEPPVKRGTFVKRKLISINEQPFFWRLKETFPEPEFVVLTQVSFGALLRAKDGASRYSFAQKFADFVLTDNAFNVKAIIELDDSSHRGREEQDAKRDEMLKDAGYKVLRYATTPDRAKLKGDVNAPTINIVTPG